MAQSARMVMVQDMVTGRGSEGLGAEGAWAGCSSGRGEHLTGPRGRSW